MILALLIIIDLSESNSKKKRSRKILIYSIIGVLIVAIIITIIVLIILFSNNNNNNDKEKKLICETGENEKCLTCDLEKDICSSCNKGYFLPEDDTSKLTCQKCPENCVNCFGTKSNATCVNVCLDIKILKENA